MKRRLIVVATLVLGLLVPCLISITGCYEEHHDEHHEMDHHDEHHDDHHDDQHDEHHDDH